MFIMLAIIGIAILCISFKVCIAFIALILFFLYKDKSSVKDIKSQGKKDPTDIKELYNRNIKEYLSKNKAFFSICSLATGIVKRIAVQEGDCLSPGDTLLYITNQSGEEDNITVGVECFVYNIMVREGDVIREGQKLADANNL